MRRPILLAVIALVALGGALLLLGAVARQRGEACGPAGSEGSRVEHADHGPAPGAAARPARGSARPPAFVTPPPASQPSRRPTPTGPLRPLREMLEEYRTEACACKTMACANALGPKYGALLGSTFPRAEDAPAEAAVRNEILKCLDRLGAEDRTTPRDEQNP